MQCLLGGLSLPLDFYYTTRTFKLISCNLQKTIENNNNTLITPCLAYIAVQIINYLYRSFNNPVLHNFFAHLTEKEVAQAEIMFDN